MMNSIDLINAALRGKEVSKEENLKKVKAQIKKHQDVRAANETTVLGINVNDAVAGIVSKDQLTLKKGGQSTAGQLVDASKSKFAPTFSLIDIDHTGPMRAPDSDGSGNYDPVDSDGTANTSQPDPASKDSKAGFALGTGTPVTGTTNNPETITGLTPLTNYEFYVQADCGGGDLSTWVGPFSFTTACAAIPAPWTDDLESLTPSTTFVSQGCWNASSVSAYDWNVDGAGSTPSSNTGPLGANSGANYFYVEASSGSAGNIATLLSPQIDVTALTLPMIEFYYHMFGGQMGNLYVDAWDGAAWNQVDVISGAQQTAQADPWLRRAIYLPGYTGITQIRFRAESQGTFEGDISLDDISILEAPSCPEPSNFSITGSDLTSADFAWSPIGSELEWQLEYGAPGFTPDVQAGTSILTGNNPETLSGLTPNTFYEIYLQAVCSPEIHHFLWDQLLSIHLTSDYTWIGIQSVLQVAGLISRQPETRLILPTMEKSV